MIYTTRYVVAMSHFSFCPAPQTFQIASPIQFLPTQVDTGIPVHATDVHCAFHRLFRGRHFNVDHLTRTRCALTNFRSEAPRAGKILARESGTSFGLVYAKFK